MLTIRSSPLTTRADSARAFVPAMGFPGVAARGGDERTVRNTGAAFPQPASVPASASPATASAALTRDRRRQPVPARSASVPRRERLDALKLGRPVMRAIFQCPCSSRELVVVLALDVHAGLCAELRIAVTENDEVIPAGRPLAVEIDATFEMLLNLNTVRSGTRTRESRQRRLACTSGKPRPTGRARIGREDREQRVHVLAVHGQA